MAAEPQETARGARESADRPQCEPPARPRRIMTMPPRTDRLQRFAFTLANLGKGTIEEVFRLGVLRDGIQLTFTDIRFPILCQAVPRIEVELSRPGFLKNVTVRVNQYSPL